MEFKRRLAKGEAATAREFIEAYSLHQNTEVAVDLLYTEFVEAEKLGVRNIEERLFGEYPQFAGELKKQINFHQALQDLDDFAPLEPDASGSTMALIQTQADSSEVGTEVQLTVSAPRIPGLDLIRPLGRGGMGIVYLAYQADLNRHVAVKLLLSGEFASKTQRARFRAEAQAAASLRHPNIVQVDDVGEYQGQPFLVMEYVEGGTLEQYSKLNPLTPVDAARLIQTLANAVHEAHLNGIVHRDLKPGNILLAKPSRDSKSGPSEGPTSSSSSSFFLVPKIADFGLVKLLDNAATPKEGNQNGAGPALTLAGDLLGTPSFMAPEQASGVNVGPWTDIYSLGAILYQLLCGRPPFLQGNAWDTLQQVINDPFPPLPKSLPRDLRIICEKCLSKEPLQRYRSMRDLASDLENFLSDKPISARPASAFQKSIRWCRRNRTVTALGTTILISLAALVVTLLWSRSHLVDMLSQTQQARTNEARSHTRALENLWDATLAEARAFQTSGKVGQKHESLKKIAEAKELFDRVKPTKNRKAMLRDVAIAALPLVDVQQAKKWLGANWTHMEFSADAKFDRFAQILPSGSIVVTEGFGEKKVLELPAHDAQKVCISPNGKFMAVWGAKCFVVNIDAPNTVIPVSDHSLGWWTFSPVNDYLIGFDHQGLMIFSLEDHSERRISGAQWPHEVALAISPNGRLLAIANQSSIQIFDLAKRNLIRELKSPESLKGLSMIWHPNNRYLAAAKYSGNRLVLWDIESGIEHRQYLVDSEAFNLSFDSSGEYLFSCPMWGGERTIFDVERQIAVLALSNRSGEMFSIDQSSLETIILANDTAEMKSLSRFETPKVLQTLQSTFGPVGYHGIRVSPDSRWVVVASVHGLETYDVVTGKRVAALPVGRLGFDQLEFDQFGRLWGNRENGWLRWEFSEDTIGQLAFIPVSEGWGTIAISPNGVWGLNSDSYRVGLQNNFEPSKSVVLGDQGDVRCACFSPDSRLLATGSWNFPLGVNIWDLNTKKLIRTLDIGGECFCRFSRDGKWLFTSPRGGEIWNTSDWSKRISLESPDKSGTGFAFDFSPDSRWCVHSNGPGQLKFVDLETKETLAVLTDPQQDAYSILAISADQQFLFGTTRGKTSAAKRWNLKELHRQVKTLGIDMAELHRSTPSTDSSSANSSSANSSTAEPGVDQSQIVQPLKVEMSPMYEQLVISDANRIAQSYFRQSEWRKGLIHLEKVHQCVPDSATIRNNLAWSLITVPTEFRDPAKSVKLAKRVVAKDDHPNYLNTLGTGLYRLGKFSEAVEALTKSAKATLDSTVAYDHYVLAACYCELGEIETASEHFSIAEDNFAKLQGERAPEQLKELETIRAEASSLIGLSQIQKPALERALKRYWPEIQRRLNLAWPDKR